jgi:hypothetical protein
LDPFDLGLGPVRFEEFASDDRVYATIFDIPWEHILNVLPHLLTFLHIRGFGYMHTLTDSCPTVSNTLLKATAPVIRATDIVARILDANLAKIEAKLWYPEGCLLKRMAS